MSAIRPVTSKTLLDYELTPDPDPPQASAASGESAKSMLALSFVASLPAASKGAYCKKLEIDLPVGAAPPTACDNASDLTCNDAFDVDKETSGEWTLESNRGGKVVFSRSARAQIVKQGYAFTLRNIEVSPVVGTTRITLTEQSSPDGKTFEPRKATFDLAKLPHAVVTLMGPSHPVLEGDPVRLTWHTANVESCTVRVKGSANPKSIDDLPHLDVVPKRPAHKTSPTPWTTTYVLESTISGGSRGPQSESTVTVLPKAPPTAGTQLVFIQTAGNPDGKIAMHVDDGERGFQKRLHDLPTGWAEADGLTGTFAIANWRSGGPTPELELIKVRDTGSAWVNVGDCSADPCFVPTSFPADWALNGVWSIAQMEAKSGSPRLPNLVFVQTVGKFGYVDVSYDTRISDAGLLGGASSFARADASKGTWLLADMDGDGLADLVFVQTAGTTSKNVELSYATAASLYTQLGKSERTAFETADAADGSWHLADMTGDGKPDLVFVRTGNTPSTRVEIQWADAASGYTKISGGFTEFDVHLGPKGAWQVIGAESPFRF